MTQLILRDILEDYRSPVHKLMGYKDPEVIISMFKVFWKKLITAVENRQFEIVSEPDPFIKIFNKRCMAFYGIKELSKGELYPTDLREITIDKLTVYLTNINLRPYGTDAFAMPIQGLMVIPNVSTRNATADLKDLKKSVLHEFTHLVQNARTDFFGSFTSRSYEDEAGEHEAFMVEMLNKYYFHLRKLKRDRNAIPNNSFFRTGKYLDFCKELALDNGLPHKIYYSLIKYKKIPNAYRFFSKAFKPFGGKPTDSNNKIKKQNITFGKSMKKYGDLFTIRATESRIMEAQLNEFINPIAWLSKYGIVGKIFQLIFPERPTPELIHFASEFSIWYGDIVSKQPNASGTAILNDEIIHMDYYDAIPKLFLAKQHVENSRRHGFFDNKNVVTIKTKNGNLITGKSEPKIVVLSKFDDVNLLIELLFHEYVHYMQWKRTNGFNPAPPIEDLEDEAYIGSAVYQILNALIHYKKKEISKLELEAIARHYGYHRDYEQFKKNVNNQRRDPFKPDPDINPNDIKVDNDRRLKEVHNELRRILK
jgi:hypothetical protein